MFIAAARIRFGDGFLEPGDSVPVEPGRSYHQMLALGEIVAVADPAPAAKPAKKAARAAGQAEDPAGS